MKRTVDKDTKTKKNFTADAECGSCKGTGVYIGMGEHDGSGVVCHTCGGTGCEKIEVDYVPFRFRHPHPKAKWVYPVNPGIGVGQGQGHTFADFGGQSYDDWFKGKPLVRGKFEMRGYTCPAWYYQTFHYDFKPHWKECLCCGSFSSCKNFKDKDKCWIRWDNEYGEKADKMLKEKKK